jgi:hypothetical protein
VRAWFAGVTARLGRLRTRKVPLGQMESRAYETAGNLIRLTVPPSRWRYCHLDGSILSMAREKATVTIDRDKLQTAKALIGAGSISETIDVALDRLIRGEQLRRDVAAYARQPFTADELDVLDLPVELDLDDADVNYDEIYGKRR